MTASIRIGTAGWNIPAALSGAFPDGGSHLARYGAHMACAEINSSFYRPHRPATYARWANSVPDGFRFAVKLPKVITHERRLADCEEPLDHFLAEAGMLGAKLGPILVQLPPKLAFDIDVAAAFLSLFRERFAGEVVCEPRHASWLGDEAGALLDAWRIARVAADPAPADGAAEPGGWPGLAYYRLHGSPRVYYSPYLPDTLDAMARRLAAHRHEGVPVWCIFDNTAGAHALGDALSLRLRLEP